MAQPVVTENLSRRNFCVSFQNFEALCLLKEQLTVERKDVFGKWGDKRYFKPFNTTLKRVSG